ncbi:MAG: DUF2938 domain-containing protein [Burkholderiales bacterium]
MTPNSQEITRVVFIGIGATVVMDLWLLLLRSIKVPTLDFALLGRWVGHLAQGTWAHASIAKARPVRNESAIGWSAHYAVGVVFAVLLVAVRGSAWAVHPSLLPAVAFGVATVVVPLFVMQPAMGAGVASSRTPAPARSCLRSVLNHTIFGVGLYLAAAAIAVISTGVNE